MNNPTHFIGKPCKKCSGNLRYKNGNCVACAKVGNKVRQRKYRDLRNYGVSVDNVKTERRRAAEDLLINKEDF